ncbi:MAG: hypothetical protein GY817_04690 [bacterium]|nr:hypothetical protein [bacterium]
MDLKVSDNDLVFENNKLVLVDGVIEIEQRLRRNLQTYQGECFLNLNLGFPYFQYIFGKLNNLTVVGDIIKDVILQTNGIIELLTFTIDYDNEKRKVKISFSATTSSGTVNMDNYNLFEGL